MMIINNINHIIYIDQKYGLGLPYTLDYLIDLYDYIAGITLLFLITLTIA